MAAIALSGPATRAQSGEHADPDAALEAYLERLELRSLLADQLEKRLPKTPKDRRGPIVERLGRLYVELLSRAQTAEQRKAWQQRGEALLASAPEVDSFELRLNLLKAVYFRAEELAERVRLRLASTQETAEADATMRSLAQQFNEVGLKVNRRVDALERSEQLADSPDKLATELAESRRLRSLAYYYAGWANVYLATLSPREQAATDALRCFGWLIGGGGGANGTSAAAVRPASVDRLQPAMLQYEHIARTAVGCALASALKGNDAEALRWLDAVEEEAQTPDAVRKQVPSRRLIVLAAANRWYDVDLLVRRMRKADRTGTGPNLTPLDPATARLLAVLALEADKRTNVDLIERLARTALGDLVAARQTAQVIDLVSRYGTAALGEAGFIVNFVRGAQAYEEARKLQIATGPSAADDEPTTDAALINKYRAAADLLGAADAQADAPEFAAERTKARLMRGRALFFGSAFSPAAEAFYSAFELAGRVQGEEPLWLSILSLERGQREAPNAALTTRLSQAVALFLSTYPESDKGARLVLLQTQTGDIPDEEAIKILSAVARDSPVYPAARRQVARLLYSRFRAASSSEREFAAQRFVAVGEEVLALERPLAMEGQGPEAVQAAERYLMRARQLLDAMLSVSTPDAQRASTLLDSLRSVTVYNSLDTKAIQPELLFRQMQIAVARGDLNAAEKAAITLIPLPDAAAFAPAAERAIYRAAAPRFKPGSDQPDSFEAARLMVVFGLRIIDRLGSGSSVLADPAAVNLYSNVAAAAADRWRSQNDQPARDLAVRLDKALLVSSPRLEPALRRLSQTAEAAGDTPAALSAWRTLLDAAQPGSPGWFEAQHESIRLLAVIDPARARQAFEQFRVLYPDLGPEASRDKFVGLDERLPPMPAAAPPGPATPTAPAAREPEVAQPPASGSGQP